MSDPSSSAACAASDVGSRTEGEGPSLQECLAAERVRVAALTEEIAKLKRQQGEALAAMEMEEEGVTNRLIKRLGELLKEKETLAQAIDREEEFLTNTLQRKMLAVQREKVDVEQRLEAEQEYIVNKLQKQMVQVSKEKIAMEKKLETERRELHARLAAAVADREQMARRLEVEDTHIQNLLNAKLGEARREKVEIEAACEVEQEYLVNKMQRRMDQAFGDRQALQRRLQSLKSTLLRQMESVLSSGESDPRLLRESVFGCIDAAFASVSLVPVVPPGSPAHSISRSISSAEAPLPFSDSSSLSDKRGGHLRKVTPGASPSRPDTPLEPQAGGVGATSSTGGEGRSGGADHAEELKSLRVEVKALRNENFVLAQKLQEERERASALSSQTSRLATDLEVDSERFFNVRSRVTPLPVQQGLSVGHRDRAASLDGPSFSQGEGDDSASLPLMRPVSAALHSHSVPDFNKLHTTSTRTGGEAGAPRGDNRQGGGSGGLGVSAADIVGYEHDVGPARRSSAVTAGSKGRLSLAETCALPFASQPTSTRILNDLRTASPLAAPSSGNLRGGQGVMSGPGVGLASALGTDTTASRLSLTLSRNGEEYGAGGAHANVYSGSGGGTFGGGLSPPTRAGSGLGLPVSRPLALPPPSTSATLAHADAAMAELRRGSVESYAFSGVSDEGVPAASSDAASLARSFSLSLADEHDLHQQFTRTLADTDVCEVEGEGGVTDSDRESSVGLSLASRRSRAASGSTRGSSRPPSTASRTTPAHTASVRQASLNHCASAGSTHSLSSTQTGGSARPETKEASLVPDSKVAKSTGPTGAQAAPHPAT